MVNPAMLWVAPKSNPNRLRFGMEEMPLEPLVMSGPEVPSRLRTPMRKISPKPRVTMAR